MIKLVVFDLDNVIIDGEAIDEIGKLANVEEDIAEITEKAMQGEIDFETSIKDRVQLLEGTSIEDVEKVAEELPLMPVDYIKMFSETRVLSSIVEISINDFQYEGCLIGRFTAKPTSQLDILTKVGENAKNIIRAKLKISFGGEESLLTVGNRNVLVFDSSDDVKDVFVSFLKVNIR